MYDRTRWKWKKSAQTRGERFLWYAPHSGFSNQLLEFKNAILMAAILNRTLIVPPLLDHHAVALGSCPKFRVLSPNELRFRVWDHAIELLRTERYVSMADILDLSSVPIIRVIDFRDFVSSRCGVALDLGCLNDSKTELPLLDALKHCGSLVSGLKGNLNNCLYAVNEDCRTTVWTYQQDGEDGSLDLFQPDEQLRTKKRISYVRRRRDVYKNLGLGSKAHFSTVLSFGSLFTAPYKGSELYIDIRDSQDNGHVQSLIEKIKFIPFISAITGAGKEYSRKIIREPFLCAQLRLLDGQFKNHRKATFSALRKKAESLKQKTDLPVQIFLMTDLPESNWSGTYLADLAADTNSFKLHVLGKADDYVIQTAQKVAASGRSIASMKKSCPGHFFT
ncbi:hypothetical protein Ancab_015975 [Ancistrocladus abbreviatus]